jgi:hypothetical protein
MGYFWWILVEKMIDDGFVASRFLESVKAEGRTFVECRRTDTPRDFSKMAACRQLVSTNSTCASSPAAPAVLLTINTPSSPNSSSNCFHLSYCQQRQRKYLVCRPHFQRMRPCNAVVFIDDNSSDIRFRNVDPISFLDIRSDAFPQRKRQFTELIQYSMWPCQPRRIKQSECIDSS